MEETVYHVVKLVGGVLDGGVVDIHTENIPFINCIVSYKTKIAHYYDLIADKAIDQFGREYLNIYYQFWDSEELTEDDEKYLEDHTNGQYKEIKKQLEESNNDNNPSEQKED